METHTDLDRTSGVPLYRQIADLLREQIRTGALSPGDNLPSERQLMERFGVTRGTIRSGLGQLRAEGLISVEHGSGAFVRQPPVARRVAGSERFLRRDRDRGMAAYLAEMEREGRTPEVEVLDVSRRHASAEMADRLGLEPGALVVRRHRVYRADRVPLEVATSWIPFDLAEGTAITRRDTGPGGLYARLEESGHPIETFEEEVTTRMPTPEERRLLLVGEGVPVLRVVRTARDASERALEVCDTIMVGDRYLLTYRYSAH